MVLALILMKLNTAKHACTVAYTNVNLISCQFGGKLEIGKYRYQLILYDILGLI